MKYLKDRFTALWLKIPKPYPALAKLATSYDSHLRKGAEILFLGDSVVERISWHDTDKRTLGQMTADALSNRNHMLCIAHAAYHFRIYYYLLNILRSTRNKPELVILPINMRCFSPQWDLNPSWQFEEEIRYLKAYPETRKVPAIRHNADALTFSDTERNQELDLPFTDLKRIGQFLDLIKNIPSDPEGMFQRRKQIYIFHYLNPLQRDHRRLAYLGKILDLMNELNIRTILYITPMNYEGGRKHVGDGFMKIIRSNAAIIQGHILPWLGKGQIGFMDFQELLTPENFFHIDELTEHLNQFGRMKLAQALVCEIEKV